MLTEIMLTQRNQLPIGFLVLVLTLLTGCQGGSSAPVWSIGERNQGATKYHVVTKGETLYSISFRYGLDYREIAKANNIQTPYVIFIDQRILIQEVKPGEAKNRVTEQPSKKTPIAVTPAKTRNASQHTKVQWQWPLIPVVTQFTDRHRP